MIKTQTQMKAEQRHRQRLEMVGKLYSQHPILRQTDTGLNHCRRTEWVTGDGQWNSRDPFQSRRSTYTGPGPPRELFYLRKLTQNLRVGREAISLKFLT